MKGSKKPVEKTTTCGACDYTWGPQKQAYPYRVFAYSQVTLPHIIQTSPVIHLNGWESAVLRLLPFPGC